MKEGERKEKGKEREREERKERKEGDPHSESLNVAAKGI